MSSEQQPQQPQQEQQQEQPATTFQKVTSTATSVAQGVAAVSNQSIY
jgi:hypothetical protein